jgi:hypothetical protein
MDGAGVERRRRHLREAAEAHRRRSAALSHIARSACEQAALLGHAIGQRRARSPFLRLLSLRGGSGDDGHGVMDGNAESLQCLLCRKPILPMDSLVFFRAGDGSRAHFDCAFPQTTAASSTGPLVAPTVTVIPLSGPGGDTVAWYHLCGSCGSGWQARAVAKSCPSCRARQDGA